MHHRFAARKKGKPPAIPRMGAQHAGQKAAGLPGLAAKLIGEQHRLIAQRAAPVRRSGAQLPHTAGDAGGHVVQCFGGFHRQQAAGLIGQLQVILFRNGQRLFTGRMVRAGRAGGDHVQRVAENIAEHHRKHLCRGAGPGEPPALDPRQPFADGVDLHNVRAAGKQLLRHILQLRKRDQRRLKQRRAAA